MEALNMLSLLCVLQMVPYKIIDGPNGDAWVEVSRVLGISRCADIIYRVVPWSHLFLHRHL
jgi:hypothetical protein